jgi:leader peptidase (prepilin peptidase)/N-methyltransferase
MFLLELVFIGIFGLIMGSFATVLCYRLPREIPLGLFSHMRSACISCKTTIPFYRNIPLLSFFLQKGKCANCHAKISRRYPIIEASMSLAFLLTYAIYSHAVLPMPSTLLYYAELAKVLYFTFALVVIVFIDLEFRIIPDRFSLGSWILALAAAFIWDQPPFWLAVAGGLMGFGIFYLLAWSYEKYKKVEGLGFGDVKMMGWLGTWVGFFGVPFVILLASLSGLAVGLIVMRASKKGLQTAIPFGPFLALGAYVAWILQTLGYW